MASSRRGAGYWASILRLLLRLINLVLALVGLAMIAYTVYMFIKFKHAEFPPHQAQGNWLKVHAPPPPPPPAKAGFPWFIIAFGSAGVLTFITAWTGLMGVSYNSRPCLGLYSILLGAMLLFQVTVIVIFFADNSWKKKLPHDDTGQAAEMEKFIRRKLAVCKWVGLGALTMQVLSMFLAFQLSAEQLKQLEADSDGEDDVWGRRRPLLANDRTANASTGRDRDPAPSAGQRARDQSPLPPSTPQRREDPWSVRMRDKYGLDTSQFGYNPEAAQHEPAGSAPEASAEPREGRGCSMM